MHNLIRVRGEQVHDLIPRSPSITCQFIYLPLHNEIRSVIDTITSKMVLILGRFTTERKAVLDALREELRNHDYLPVLFDFDKPASKDLTGTVSTLANMALYHRRANGSELHPP